MRICFIRISGLKFAKFYEYFKNKPEAKILKRICFCVEKLQMQYNYMLLTKRYKILPFSKQQN